MDSRSVRVLLCLILLMLPGWLCAAESPYLYGIHDHEPRPEEYLNRIKNFVPGGWITATVEVGHDVNNQGGVDFSWYANNNVSVICRINHGYFPNGTIPLKEDYDAFAQRCANFVRNSPGCNIWVIGNELNIAGEWPARGDHLAYVSPTDYAECYRKCYDAIKAVSPNHKILSAPCAPFSGPFGSGSVGGKTHDGCPLLWVDYQYQMLGAIKSTGPIDGIALHVYSRGYNPSDVLSTWQRSIAGKTLYWSFFCYKDWINYGIPADLYNLPCYITECDGYYFWKGGHPENPAAHYEPGWMQEVYKEIDSYNRTVAIPGHKPVIRCVNMYRWCCCYDGWAIDGHEYKNQILSDLDVALAYEYSWPGSNVIPAAWTDDFNDTSVDENAPEPDWSRHTENGSRAEESGGYLRLTGVMGNAHKTAVRNNEYRVYRDFNVETKLVFANTALTGGTSGSAEVRFRATKEGVGYTLVFEPGSPGTISLKRSDTGEVIQGKTASTNIANGTALFVRIKCDYAVMTVQVGTTQGGSDVVNWTLTDSTFLDRGCFWMQSNNLAEVDFDFFGYQPFAPGLQGVVKDSLGNVVGGVTVATTTGGYSGVTEADGMYVIPNMAPGTYTVNASKTGYATKTVTNVMLTSGATVQNFTITDNSRPNPPLVFDAGAWQTGTDSLSCSWSNAVDPETPVTGYVIAFCKTPNLTDVIPGGGQVLVTGNSHTRTGLSLVNGQTYYAMVKARNAINLISNPAWSDGLKVAQGVARTSEAKAQPDGRMIALEDRIVTASFPECIYVEDPDRSGGIRVDATGVAEGTQVDLAGFLSTVDGERRISGYAVVPGETGRDLKSFWMPNWFLYGTGLTAYTPGYLTPTIPGVGMNNVGLLITTWGRVTDSGTGYIVVKDGAPKNVTLKVTLPSGVDSPTVGQFVVVTGINTAYSDAGTLIPVLRARKPSDVWVVTE